MKKTAASSPLAPGSNERGTVFGVCLFLAALVWVVFGQTVHYQFVNYDDDVYVTQNQVVEKGLSWAGCRWALTSFYGSNWHPLTWFSHMLDCQFYGFNPAGHHFTSVLLHTATVILLFLVLRRLTGFLWRSAFVAAVFAIHPLRVESVAWVAERKDVLCGLFFVLTLGAYARYAQRPSRGRYLLVAVLFVLALMSKPMAVTLPFVLLLLDYWPLKRFTAAGGTLPPRRLILEKLPLLVLSGASCTATIFAQQNAMVLVLSLSARISNALVSCAVYVEQLFYPAGLTIFYPYPEQGLASGKIIAAAVFLLAVSAGAVITRRKQPWFLTGWLWYLGMLVPVIGLLQVGMQAHADRYTYLPEIGLLVAVTWTVAEGSAGWRHRRLALGFLATISLTALVFSARAQTACWRTSESLWTSALARSTDNATVRNNLGQALLDDGKLDEAIAQFQRALQIEPGNLRFQNNLGFALSRQGRLDDAIAQYQQALQTDSSYPQLHYNLGLALVQKGDPEAAIVQFQQALQLKPDYAEAHCNLANALMQTGHASEAMVHYQTALEIRPVYLEASYKLGQALLQTGKTDEAMVQFQKVLQSDPQHARTHYYLATALFAKGREEEAIAHYRKALQTDPDFLGAQNDLAWALATAPQASLRNGTQAVALAQRANQSTGGTNWNVVSTLAAAEAEAGRFNDAVQHAQTAMELARTAGQPDQARQLSELLKLYQAGQPYHRSSP